MRESWNFLTYLCSEVNGIVDCHREDLELRGGILIDRIAPFLLSRSTRRQKHRDVSILLFL